MFNFLSRRKAKPKALYQGEYARQLRRQLVSWDYQVTGKPDYIVDHEGFPIPVLVKAGQAPGKDPHDSHVAQILVYCLLIHEVTKVPPPYGIIRYADRTFEVDYHEAAAHAILDLIDEIKAARQQATLPGRSHESKRRCFACRHRRICDHSLLMENS